MGKIRNYTYGSPKFEGEINKAISEAGGDVKVYQHNLYIVASDANNNFYYGIFAVYNTSPDALLDAYTATLADVVSVLKSTCYTYATPYYFEEGTNYSLYLKQDDSLWGVSYAFSSNQTTNKAITTLISAYDTVLEM